MPLFLEIAIGVALGLLLYRHRREIVSSALNLVLPTAGIVCVVAAGYGVYWLFVIGPETSDKVKTAAEGILMLGLLGTCLAALAASFFGVSCIVRRLLPPEAADYDYLCSPVSGPAFFLLLTGAATTFLGYIVIGEVLTPSGRSGFGMASGLLFACAVLSAGAAYFTRSNYHRAIRLCRHRDLTRALDEEFSD
jgi:Na+/serine symporter